MPSRQDATRGKKSSAGQRATKSSADAREEGSTSCEQSHCIAQRATKSSAGRRRKLASPAWEKLRGSARGEKLRGSQTKAGALRAQSRKEKLRGSARDEKLRGSQTKAGALRAQSRKEKLLTRATKRSADAREEGSTSCEQSHCIAQRATESSAGRRRKLASPAWEKLRGSARARDEKLRGSQTARSAGAVQCTCRGRGQRGSVQCISGHLLASNPASNRSND